MRDGLTVILERNEQIQRWRPIAQARLWIPKEIKGQTNRERRSNIRTWESPSAKMDISGNPHRGIVQESRIIYSHLDLQLG